MRCGGFTLIEAAVTTVIVGLAVLSVMAAQQAYHQQTYFAQKVSTGLMLATEIRELTLTLPQHDPITGTDHFGAEANEWVDGDLYQSVEYFDDMDDFAGPDGTGINFSPPVDGLRQQIPNMESWTQIVTVEPVDKQDISGPDVGVDTTNLLRLTVRVTYLSPAAPDGIEPIEVAELNWVTAGRTQ
jgi:type II secretory pathway pseudopilin PulG